MTDTPTSPGNKQGISKRVLVAGATGYIGQCVVREFVKQGHDVISFARERAGIDGRFGPEQTRQLLHGSEVRFGNVCDLESILDKAICGERFDTFVSCLASRTGGIKDAWKLEYEANLNLLEAGKRAGINHFILLSAICVQKPLLAFQRAKLKFEQALTNSGIHYTIVRPTAFFKSLSGQVDAVKKGKPFTVFGDGTLTACKPISEHDLACFIAECLHDSGKLDRVLPIGGPGEPITPRQQGELLFELCGREAKFRQVPVRLFDVIISLLQPLSVIFSGLKDKVEFARIGRYYATESMLVLDQVSQTYNANATPSYGNDTLRDFYKRVLKQGLAGQELGDHTLFK